MDLLLLATKGDRGVVERKVPVVVAVAANDGEPEEPRDVQYVVVAVTEGELEGVVEATALRVQCR